MRLAGPWAQKTSRPLQVHKLTRPQCSQMWRWRDCEEGFWWRRLTTGLVAHARSPQVWQVQQLFEVFTTTWRSTSRLSMTSWMLHPRSNPCGLVPWRRPSTWRWWLNTSFKMPKNVWNQANAGEAEPSVFGHKDDQQCGGVGEPRCMATVNQGGVRPVGEKQTSCETDHKDRAATASTITWLPIEVLPEKWCTPGKLAAGLLEAEQWSVATMKLLTMRNTTLVGLMPIRFGRCCVLELSTNGGAAVLTYVRRFSMPREKGNKQAAGNGDSSSLQETRTGRRSSHLADWRSAVWTYKFTAWLGASSRWDGSQDHMGMGALWTSGERRLQENSRWEHVENGGGRLRKWWHDVVWACVDLCRRLALCGWGWSDSCSNDSNRKNMGDLCSGENGGGHNGEIQWLWDRGNDRGWLQNLTEHVWIGDASEMEHHQSHGGSQLPH